MEIPGKVGWPIVGDKSVEFYRDPLKFLDKYRASTGHQVFAARFLNKPTVFVCSHEGVQDVLNDAENVFDLGYEAFMGPMFGHNILFSKDEEAQVCRKALSQLFTTDCLCDYEESMKGEPFCLYKFFKSLFTEICLTLFLGLDFSESQEIAETIMSLTTEHWRGIVAVPLDLKLPGVKSTTYGKALEAKARLLEVIHSQRSKAQCGFPRKMKETFGFNETAVNNHLLLFTSALVPKVLASICTSLCIETGQGQQVNSQKKAKEDGTFLEHLLLEVQRLHPPLLGGRRLARKNCTIAGYNVPKDYAVVFMTQPAQRDPAVFDHPCQFMPERWHNQPELRNKLFVYGCGPRACIGQNLSWLILQTTCKDLLSKFSWEICQGQDFTHKHLPVSRPRCNLMGKMIPW